MIRFLLFLLFLLFLNIIFLLISKNKKVQILFSLTLITLIIFAYFFEIKNNKNDIKEEEILQKFKDGKIIKCGDNNVSRNNFNYEFGTSSFISKKSKKTYSIKNCL